MQRAKDLHKFVLWSGGRDSTVMLHLALKAWDRDFKTVFVDTGITLPETLVFIRKQEKAWSLDLAIVRPGREFWPYARRYGFPSFKRLWCRTHFKVRPLVKYLNQFKGWKLQALGVRRTESVQRMRSEFYKHDFMRDRKVRLSYSFHPIRNWTDKDVAMYVAKHEIPVNPCYEIYKTTGCYYCPFVQNREHYITLRDRHPALFNEILKTELAMEKGSTAIPGWSMRDLAP